jgi:tRNA-dihydrouridine synthase
MTDFILQPSDNPGSHERHLNRKHQNPIFDDKQTELDQLSMLEAQEQDHQILLDFHKEFQDAIQKTINLKPNEESDVILGLKDTLDKLYERVCQIADDQSETKEALVMLVGIIMKSIRKGAEDDQQAIQELDQEEAAREAHYQMLESKLVADLLDPDSPIQKDDLVPTLLSSEKDDLALAVQLFDEDQLKEIIKEAESYINALGAKKIDINAATENLVFIQGYIEYINLPQNS